ncbi:hypothetical protein TNCV_3313991, partial [Trichonephila clavipes]
AGWTGAEHKAPHPDLFLHLTSHRPLKWPTSDAQFDRTSQIRCAAFEVPTIRPSLKNVCRGQPTCPRCGNQATTAQIVKKKEQCLNSKGEHPAYSRSCPTWITEKEITAVKLKEKFPTQRHGVLFWHARRSLVRVMLVPPVRAHRISVSNVTLKDISLDSSTPTEPEVIAPSKTIHPLERRDFHRKIEADTLTGDCSEDDEDLMDIQSGPSTSSSRGGASAAQ